MARRLNLYTLPPENEAAAFLLLLSGAAASGALVVLAALLVGGCSSAPPLRCGRAIPAIPSMPVEVYACNAPGAPSVRVRSASPPEDVSIETDAGPVPARCSLVLLPEDP